MTEQYRVGSKGQIVIPKEIRDAHRIEAGAFALQTWVDDHLEVRFVGPEHNESLRGMLAPYIKRRAGKLEWHEIREKAWSAHVQQRYGRKSRR